MSDGKLIFDTKLDTDGIKKDLQELEKSPMKIGLEVETENIKTNVEKAVQSADVPPVKLDADLIPAQETVEEFTPKSTLTVVTDDGTFKHVKDELGNISSTKIAPSVEPEIDEDARESYQATLKEIEDRKAKIKMEVDANTEPAKQKTDNFKPKDNEIKIDANMDGAEEKMKTFSDLVRNWADKNATMIGTALGNLAGNMIANLGTSLWNGIKNTSQAGDEIDKMSAKMGLSREGYQEWGYVLRQNGADVKSLQSGMTQLNNTVDKTKKGNKEAAAQFNKLGIEIDDLEKMSREDIFEAVVSGLQDISEDGEKAAIATALFGDSAVELLPTLQKTIKETEALKKEAHDLGTVMSDSAVTASVEMGDNFDKMGAAWDGITSKLMTAVMPIASGLFDTVSGLIGGLNDMFDGPPSNELTDELNKAKEALGNVRDNISDIKQNFGREAIKIQIKYDTSIDLLDEYDKLAQKENITESDITRMQEIVQTLVSNYDGLSQYVGDNGLINAEIGQVRDLIGEYAELDKQRAYSTMVSDLKAQKMQAELSLNTAKQVLQSEQGYVDEYNRINEELEWIQAKVLGNVGTIYTYDTIGDNLQVVKDYFDTLRQIEGIKDPLGDIDTSQFQALDELLKGDWSQFGNLDVSNIEAGSQAAAELFQIMSQLYAGSLDANDALNEQYGANIANVADAQKKVVEWTEALATATLYSDAAVKGFTDMFGISPDDFLKSLDKVSEKTGETAENVSRDKAATKEAVDEQAEAVSEIETKALTVEELAASIKTATESGTTAQEALAAAKAQVSIDAAAILTEMDTYVTNLGTYVTTMKDTMVQTIDDAKVEAAEAGRNFAQGAAEGYAEKPVLKTSVDNSISQALETLRANAEAFRQAGASLMQKVAEGMDSNARMLGESMAGAISRAFAAAESETSGSSVFRTAAKFHKKRTGLEYVPYDEYPAMLHKGESVLTASEAALWRGGMYVREPVQNDPLDYRALAEAIWDTAPESKPISITLDGRLLAESLEPYVSAVQGGRVKSGRYG